MYKELDKRIVDAVAQKKNPLYAMGVNEEAKRISVGTGREVFRVIDGRLQALRKSGKIFYMTKAEGNGQGGWHSGHAA